MHYFYDPVYGSYTGQHDHHTQRMPTNQYFSGKTIYWSCFTMHYMVLNNIQLNTIICVATYITDHILVIIYQQRHDYHGRLPSEMASSA